MCVCAMYLYGKIMHNNAIDKKLILKSNKGQIDYA